MVRPNGIEPTVGRDVVTSENLVVPVHLFCWDRVLHVEREFTFGDDEHSAGVTALNGDEFFTDSNRRVRDSRGQFL